MLNSYPAVHAAPNRRLGSASTANGLIAPTQTAPRYAGARIVDIMHARYHVVKELRCSTAKLIVSGDLNLALAATGGTAGSCEHPDETK